MPHIVVATSLTHDRDPAVERAAEVSRAMGADLRLLHVLPDLLPGFVAEPRQRKAQGRLLHWTRRLARETGHHVSYKVGRGDVARRIVRESEDLDAVLTVIGHTQVRRRAPRLFGTTAARSLQEARGAVLIVRSDLQCRAYRKAVIAYDGVIGEDRLLTYLPHLAPQATLHPYALPAKGRAQPATRRVAAHVTAMRRAIDADLLVIGMPNDETMNPFRFRRLPASLTVTPECDTLIVPQDACADLPEAPATLRMVRTAV